MTEEEIKCDRCGSLWDDEHISKLILNPEGQGEVIDLGRASHAKICSDCRSRIWAEVYS